jgi:hypothetical protein
MHKIQEVNKNKNIKVTDISNYFPLIKLLVKNIQKEIT